MPSLKKELVAPVLAGFDALIKAALESNDRRRYKEVADLADQAELLLEKLGTDVASVDGGDLDNMQDDGGMGIVMGGVGGRPMRNVRRRQRAAVGNIVQAGAFGNFGGDDAEALRTMMDALVGAVGPQAEKAAQDARTGRAIELRELVATKTTLEVERRKHPKGAKGAWPGEGTLAVVVARIAELEKEMAAPPAVPATTTNGAPALPAIASGTEPGSDPLGIRGPH